jgi:hypothetical protein
VPVNRAKQIRYLNSDFEWFLSGKPRLFPSAFGDFSRESHNVHTNNRKSNNDCFPSQTIPIQATGMYYFIRTLYGLTLKQS